MRTHLIRTAALSVALVLVLLTLGFWVVLRQRLHDAAEVVLRQRMQAAQALVVVDNGRLTVEETSGDEALETGFWLYDAQRRVVAAPATRSDISTAAGVLAVAGSGERNVAGTRLLAEPVLQNGSRVGTVVIGEPLAAFRDSERVALSAAVVLDVLALGGASLLTRRTVSRALEPVASMTAAAQEWSAHDLQRRFALGPATDELTGLAATLDSLLERLAASLRQEQRLTAEIAHELKTPLARIASTAEVVGRYGDDREQRDALAELHQEAVLLAAVVDTLLAAHPPWSLAPTVADLGAVLLEEAQRLANDRPDVTLQLQLQTEEATVAADAPLLRRVVNPLLSNAFRHARTEVSVSVRRVADTVVVAIDDDGSGFTQDELEVVFEPGYRGSTATGDGHGLGLPLSRRLARSLAGDVRIEAGPGGHVRLTLPAA